MEQEIGSMVTGWCMIGMMGMIGYWTANTVQEISGDNRESGREALYITVGFGGCIYVWIAACVIIRLATERCNLICLLSLE